MSLTMCSKCGANVSSNAKACPSCGASKNQTTGQCKTCNATLNADDVYGSVAYIDNGTSNSRVVQRACPKCGDPKPFNVATQVTTGGSNEAIMVVVILAITIGLMAAVLG